MKLNLLASLQMHRSLHRTEETQTKCTICNFDPKDERLSKEHIELHKGLSPLQCVICKKMINHKRNIIPHMRLHVTTVVDFPLSLLLPPLKSLFTYLRKYYDGFNQIQEIFHLFCLICRLYLFS